MAEIRVLPVTVQNQIAAGEVIERPASVVKELVENAIDAGARQVDVTLEEGGHRLIRVCDDGSGMDEANLIRSLERHATSKIADTQDIYRIATFGFRGEALPSIASVSRLSLITCLAGEDTGHELLAEAGHLLRIAAAPIRKGTQIEVRDLFYNTPARRKFLKIPASENTRAAEILTRIALGNPSIGFRLQLGDRLALSLAPAASQYDRLRDLFGERIGSRLVPFKRDSLEGIRVVGYFARPPESRRNAKDVYLLVNRRWIRYFGLARAISDTFAGILPPRSYPFAVVNLLVEPGRVDVNVHPMKEEVRFDQENLLISCVRKAIGEALERIAGVPAAGRLGDAAVVPPSAGATPAAGTLNPAASPAAPMAASLPASPSPAPARDSASQRSLLPPPLPSRRKGQEPAGLDLSAAREKLRGIAQGDSTSPGDSIGLTDTLLPEGGLAETPKALPAASASTGPMEKDPASQPGPDGVRTGSPGLYRILGQVGGKYILVDVADGLLLVDPHALHERWNFDRLKAERGGGNARRLLLPVEMHLSPAEAAAAAEVTEELSGYGFGLEFSAGNQLKITAAPAFIRSDRLENLIRSVLGDVGGAQDALTAARDKVLASMACRMSVLLGRSLSREEIDSLLERFFHQGQLPTCPHGRPTAIRIGWEELARRFGR